MHKQSDLFAGELRSSDIVQLARERSIYVETEKNYGGGVLVVTGLVVTTLHFIEGQKRLRVGKRSQSSRPKAAVRVLTTTS